MTVQISFQDMQQIVISRLNQWIAELGPAADKPREIVGTNMYSPRDLLREVQQGTQIGVAYVQRQAAVLGYTVVG